MNKWYAVYTGEGDQAYSDGFTEIVAPDYNLAVRAFRAFHQDGESKTLPCGEFLCEADFKLFSHSEKLNTWGKERRERITVIYTQHKQNDDQIHELISYFRTLTESWRGRDDRWQDRKEQ